MTHRTIRLLTALALVAALSALAGCAKKATQTPPVPSTPPPTTAPSTPAPTPAPAPSEPAPSTPAFQAGDLRPAFFDLDSYSLSAAARAVLDANARVLRDNPGVRLVIEGHCDERGTVEYNQALGERRAQTARDYLVNAGIDGARLSVISYGKERPFATGSDEAAWAQNRRAHFTVR